jgi:RNA polymerase sigma factor (sigma-70 family)
MSGQPQISDTSPPVAEQDGWTAAALVKGCLSGDDCARALLVNAAAPIIRKSVVCKLAALSVTPPVSGDADDICNDILERLLRDECRILRQLHKPGSLNAWLNTLARNHTIDYIRKHGARMRGRKALESAVPAEDAAESPREKMQRQEVFSELRDALEKLADIDRMLIMFYFQENLTYAEIAEMTGRNVNTVASRIRRARLKLRELLEKAEREGGHD